MQARAFARRFAKELNADSILDVAAMMTYYAVFALFPMLVFVVTMALLILPGDVITTGAEMAADALPPDVGGLVIDQVARMQGAAGAGFAIGGALLAIWGASRGAVGLMTALNDIFDKEESRPWWKRQLIAIAATLIVAALLLLALFLLTAGPAIGHALAERLALGDVFDAAWSVGRWIAAALLVMVVWAVLYKWLPDTDAPFRIFTPGAITGVLLWIGVTQAFGLYLDNFGSYEKTYGALAGVIIFLTWLWLSNLAILVGAEVNDVLAELRKDSSPAAAKLAEAEKAPHEKSRTPAMQPAKSTS
jgi:membrane protein